MRTEDVLKATKVGLWRWDSATGASTVDLCAARLLGIPVRQGGGESRPISVSGPGSDSVPEAGAETEAGPDAGFGFDTETLTLSEPAVRSRIHVADYVDLMATATLALTEGSLVEAVMRVVDQDGRVVRTVRSRMMPQGEGETLAMIGTVAEVPESTTERLPPLRDGQLSKEAFLLSTGRALAEARTTAEVLRVAGSLAMPGFVPRSLAVLSREGDQLSLIGSHAQRPVPKHLLPFMEMSVDADHPAAEVVRTGRAIYLPGPDDYRRRYPAVWPEVERVGNRGWAWLPLTVSRHTLGAWMVAFAEPVDFTAEDRSLLTNVARMLAQAISRTSMHETELQLSAGLQRTLRPTRRPAIEGMSLAARYVPAGGGVEVGGDWFDVIPLPSGRTALVIGDVQGHDVRAAGIMAQLRIALRAYAAEGHRPDAVLSRSSRFLAGLGRPEQTGGEAGDPAEAVPSETRFATCLYMEADPVTGTLDVARAGHPDPALWLSDGTMLIRPTAGGLPLGLDPGTEYPTTRLVLEPGETLLVCTDGLIETGGHTIDTGWRRIRQIAEEESEDDRGPEDLERFADALVRSAHSPLSGEAAGPLADRREDDIALLLLSLDPVYAAERAVAAEGVSRRTTLAVAQAEPERIGEARHQLQGMLFDWVNEDQIDAAVLMLSEMLTNVLQHTEGDARVVAECSGSRGARLLRVEVADTSDALPHRRTPGELASSGRGLVMMEMLAGAWGVDPRGEGKSIWFEMHEDAPSPDWS